MNPSESFYSPSRPQFGKPPTGFKHDGRKIPLATFLHVNTLTEFQRTTISRFMDAGADQDDISATIGIISKQIDALSLAKWSPSRAQGDAVVQPDHYARFPIEPTFFNMENGIDWCLGNALKYICRFPFKNGIEDLKKAMRYLAMWVRYQNGEEGWSK